MGIVAAILAGILFGVGGTLAQFLFTERGVNVEWLVTMRMLVSGPLLLLACAATRGRAVLAIWRQDAAALVLFAIVGMLGVQITFMAAIAASNTATATVIQYTAPAMVAFWLAVVQRQMPGWNRALAIVLAMAGTFFLVTHGELGRLNITLAAFAWGIGSAVTAAFNAIQPSGMLKRHGAALVTGWGMVIGGIALSFVHPPWAVEGTWDWRAIVFLAFILLLGTLLAFYLSLKAVQLAGPQKSSVLGNSEPVSAALLAVLWLNVAWGPWDWLGMALVLVTVVLLAREQTPQSQAEHVT